MFFREHAPERRAVMPVIWVMWAIPAIIVIGGGAYWIAHIH
jgi:hypothetical protein